MKNESGLHEKEMKKVNEEEKKRQSKKEEELMEKFMKDFEIGKKDVIVNLIGQPMTEEDCESCRIYLMRSQYCTNIDVSEQDYSDKGAQIIMEGVKQSEILKGLFIRSGNPNITDETHQKLDKLLKEKPLLEYIF